MPDSRHLLATESARFDELPLFHRGASRIIRSLPSAPGLLIARLRSVVHSWAEKGAVDAPGTALIRARINAIFCDLLHAARVRTSTLATLGEYVLMRDERVASTIEVVFKSRFGGSPKHRYPTLPGAMTLQGQRLSVGAEHAPYVRFDWRNVPPLEDEVLPEGLARMFIDVAAATACALRAREVLNEHLAPRDLKLVDGCFFMSQDGQVICGEVSPDNLTIEYTGADSSLARVLGDRSKEGVAQRWGSICEIVG